MTSQGITCAWLTFCKEFYRKEYPSFRMDFADIGGSADNDIIEEYKNVKVHLLPIPSRTKSPLKYMKSLYSALKREKYDIIHVNGSSNLMTIELFTAWLAGVKVRVAHSRNTSCSHHFIHKCLSIPFSLFCNARLACGQDAGEWLFGKKPFVIIHNGKDYSKFRFSPEKRDAMRDQYGLKDKFVIGHVGKINEQKNHDYLIDIFSHTVAKIPNAVLLLIGSGPLEKAVKEKVKRLGLQDNVIFTGEIKNVDFMLQGADIMVFPSLFEGLPNVVLEWQALGLPCLISDTITKECSVCDLIEYEDIKQDPALWAEHISEIKTRDIDRKKASTEGISRLKDEGFDISDSSDLLIDTYRNFLKLKR